MLTGKHFLCVLLLALSCCHAAFSQEERFAVKVGIGTPGNQTAVFPEISETMRVMRMHGAPAYRIETGYTFPRHITVEAYVAYADVLCITEQSYEVDDQGMKTKAGWLSTEAYYYGAKVGYHPLAGWLESRDAWRWDMYYMLCVGGVSADVKLGSMFEYSLCIGGVFYFAPRWGYMRNIRLGCSSTIPTTGCMAALPIGFKVWVCVLVETRHALSPFADLFRRATPYVQ